MQEPEEKKFFKKIQLGDLALLNPIRDAIVVFGQSKTGKTTSCHDLSNNPLKSVKHKTGDLVWETASKVNQIAIIGSTSHSQTQIPNLFSVTINIEGVDQYVTLIDQPGYVDTNGFFRIFANGYYHYRTFSKTPKLRFVLAFQQEHLKGKGNIKRTIESFIQSFKDYDGLEKTILEATSFLITKVDTKVRMSHLTDSLKELIRQMPQGTDQIYWRRSVKMVQRMMDDSKIFVIGRPSDTNQITKGNSDLLRQIYLKTKSWDRELLGDVADMENINFSVVSVILDQIRQSTGKIFKENFSLFMKELTRKFNQFITIGDYSIKSVIDALTEDCTREVDSSLYLTKMKGLVDQEYCFNQDHAYKAKRDTVEEQLFLNLQFTPEELKSEIPIVHAQVKVSTLVCLRKFKALESIAKIIKNMIESKEGSLYKSRSILWIDQMGIEIFKICKQLDQIRGKAIETETITRKYCYLMKRMFEEAKIVTIIILGKEDAADQLRTEIDELFSVYIKLTSQLFDVLDGAFNMVEIKREFISKQVANIPTITAEVVEFVQELYDKNPVDLLAAAKITLKYAQTTLKKKTFADHNSQKKQTISKLLSHRKEMIQIAKDPSSEYYESAQYYTLALTNLIGDLLNNLGKSVLAREVYSSIWNTQEVIKSYEKELLQAAKVSIENERALLISLGDYASSVNRKELAFSCYQKALFKDLSEQAFRSARQRIRELSRSGINSDAEAYMWGLQKNIFYFALQPKFEKEIKDFAQASK